MVVNLLPTPGAGRWDETPLAGPLVLGSMGGGFLGESNLKKLFVTV